MYNPNFEVYNDEYSKDLYREAEHARLVKSAAKNEGALKHARKALGRGLVAVGQNLLNQD